MWPGGYFRGSGGAGSALALVSAHPENVPNAEYVFACEHAVQHIYRKHGWGHGMAAFLTPNLFPGEYTDVSVEQLFQEPSRFGLPSADDRSRNDPLLSGVSNPVTTYWPDFAALAAAPTSITIASVRTRKGFSRGVPPQQRRRRRGR